MARRQGQGHVDDLRSSDDVTPSQRTAHGRLRSPGSAGGVQQDGCGAFRSGSQHEVGAVGVRSDRLQRISRRHGGFVLEFRALQGAPRFGSHARSASGNASFPGWRLHVGLRRIGAHFRHCRSPSAPARFQQARLAHRVRLDSCRSVTAIRFSCRAVGVAVREALAWGSSRRP
jgi:hypothetical protein